MNFKNASLRYLTQAKERILEASEESLIYAALDLRMAVEARLHQYTEANRHVLKTKEWRISTLSRELEKAFKQRDQTAEIGIYLKDEIILVEKFFYTPVSKSLQRLAGKLGNYLHYGKNSNFEELKSLLLLMADQIELANKGSLLGAPMLNTKTKQVHMSIEEVNLVKAEALIELLQGKSEFILNVNYHKEYPE